MNNGIMNNYVSLCDKLNFIFQFSELENTTIIHYSFLIFHYFCRPAGDHSALLLCYHVVVSETTT